MESITQLAELPILIADVGDWIGIIAVLFFVLGPILNAIGGGQNAKGKPGKLPRRIPPARGGQPQVPPLQRPGGAAPPAQPGRGRQALENEVEEFLRRAGKGGRQPKRDRAQNPSRSRQQAAPPRQQQPKKHVSLAERQLKKEAMERKAAQQEQAEQVAKRQQKQQRQRERLGDGIGQHVREHISSHPVGEHSHDLAKEIGQSDERIEQHLHSVFDHQLGGLAKEDIFEETQGTDSAVWDKRVTVSPASKFRKMLKDPNSIRNAIVLTEIFKQPVSLD